MFQFRFVLQVVRLQFAMSRLTEVVRVCCRWWCRGGGEGVMVMRYVSPGPGMELQYVIACGHLVCICG